MGKGKRKNVKRNSTELSQNESTKFSPTTRKTAEKAAQEQSEQNIPTKKRRKVSMNDEITVYPIPKIEKRIPNELPPKKPRAPKRSPDAELEDSDDEVIVLASLNAKYGTSVKKKQTATT